LDAPLFFYCQKADAVIALRLLLIRADSTRIWFMRLIVYLALGALMAIAGGGCQSAPDDSSNGVKVVIEGKGAFPKALAGRWRANRDGWQLVFEPDGRLSAAVLSLGQVQVAPGKRTTVPTRSGGEGVFDPGLWTVHYVPATQELTVKISMDHVRIELGGNTLEGNSTDIFAGKVVPSDGLWQAEWTTFTDYTAQTPEGLAVKLATDATYGEAKLLTFRKVPTQ
jgi:hypothetical protein